MNYPAADFNKIIGRLIKRSFLISDRPFQEEYGYRTYSN